MDKDIEKQKKALHDISISLNQSKQQNEDIKAEIVKGTGELKLIKNEFETVVKDKNAMLVQIEALAKEQELEVQKHEAVIAEFDAMLDAREAYKAELENALANMEEEKKMLEEQNTVLASTISKKVKEFEAKEQKATVTIADKQAELAEIKSAIKAAKAELDGITSERDAVTVAISTIVSQKSEVEAAVAALKKEYDSVKNKKTQVDEIIEINAGNLEVLETELERLEQERATLQAEVDGLVTEKFAFAEAKKALEQKEAHIRQVYQTAGVKFPE